MRSTSAGLAVLGCILLASPGPAQEALRIGELVEGEITDADALVSTPRLDAGHTNAPTLGRLFTFVAPELGTYTIELRSWHFDTYLVLRDAHGNVLAEDDDGLLSTHSQLATPELEIGVTYLVQACALHGARGPFELVLREGAPRPLSPAERAQAEISDLELRATVLEEASGPETDALAGALNRLGLALYRQGRYSDARGVWERALSIREKVLGPEHPDTALSLNNLGSLLEVQGELSAARAYLERALSIREKVLGPDHPDTARSLNNLGALLQAQGELAAARPYYERMLSITEEALGPEHPDTAASLNNLGVLLLAQGELAAARPYLERALSIREKVLGPEHPDTALSLNNLGSLLEERGELSAARAYLERALSITEKVLGPEHPETASSLNSLGLLLYAQGELVAARPSLERALAITERVLGPEHPKTAQSLNNLGALLKAQGELAAARPYFERALAIWEQVLGPEHPETATSLNNLGALLRAQGEWAAAWPYYERALSIRQNVLGPEHPDTATSLNNLGALLAEQAELGAARPYFERALAIREQVLGPEDPDTATSLNNLGALLVEQAELGAALPYFERALSIREKILGPEHPQTAESLSHLGSLLAAQGELAAARPYSERALAIREQVLGPEHPDTAASLNNLGFLLRRQGELAAARPYYERALAIREALGPEHPETATSLNNLGVLLEVQGDLAAARPYYERALAIREEVLGPEHPDTAGSLNNLAILLKAQGELAAARPYYERSLAILEKILGPEHPDTATSLSNLGFLLQRQGELAAARPYLERALSIHEQVLGPEHPDTARSLNNLGGLLQAQGELAAARPLFQRASAIWEEVLGPEHPDTASSLNNLGALLKAQGELAAARPYLERALAIAEEVLGPEHPDTAQSLNDLALVLTDLGERTAARDLVLSSAPGRRAHLQRMLGALTEAESFQYLATLRWQLEVRLCLLKSEEPGILAEAYEGVLAWKGQIARALVADRERLGRELTEEQRELVEGLRAKQAQLSRALSDDDSPDQAEHLAALRQERNRLELELGRTLEGSAGTYDLTLADVRAALPSQAAVLDLFVQRLYEPAAWSGQQLVRRGFWTEEHVIAWIVRPNPPDGGARAPALVRVDLGPAAVLEEACRAFLEELVARRGAALSDEGGPDSARELRRLLWDPLVEHLAGVETLFVSPDTFLGTLPFETIELEGGSFLVEELSIVYLQDVSSLARREGQGEGEYGSLLAMGAVDFRKRAEWRSEASELVEAASPVRGSFTDYWGRLPATGYESQVVSDMHEDAFGEEGERLLLQGAEPSEERLKHELQRHSVLHLATHGFFQPEGTPSMWESALNEAGKREMRMSEGAAYLVGMHPGLLSGLVCAGANRQSEEGEDGYLTAEEVGWLDLSRAELVVMSACETGLGRAKSGEGLIGLRRAFQIAGAKTVISSLWSVKDESTAELMRDFYKNLFLEGMGRHEALRAAQLAMLRRNRMEHGEALPSTWGAFVLSGEWR